MRTFHSIIVLCCGVAVACSSNEPTFPREETLTPEFMPLQGVTNPIRVEVKHPFLILQNYTRTDSLFHIYDLRNNALKSAFGVTGRGPVEFVSSWLLHTQLSNILINDSGKNLVSKYSINEEGEAILKETQQPSYIEGVSNAAFINDSLFVLDAQYMAPSLYLLSWQDELPRKTRQFRNPDITDYYIDPDMGSVYANESRIALCYGYKKQIDFMDTDLNLVKSIKFKHASPSASTIDSEDGGDVKRTYIYGYFGKRYLYALFLGTSWNEHRGALSHCGTSLEVFDLDGNPVIRYHLNGIRPTYFAVDEKDFTLYGAGGGAEPEDHLVVYKLKGLS